MTNYSVIDSNYLIIKPGKDFYLKKKAFTSHNKSYAYPVALSSAE